MVYSLLEAMEWFLSHSSGTVICIKDDEQKECNCYNDAVAFYK